MTPEEKAKELIEKFGLAFGESYGYNKNKAINCATICANEILITMKKENPSYKKETYWHPIDYWLQVKQHLST